LQFGLRLGTNPQSVVTTTPKPTKLIRDLLSRKKGIHLTRGSTFDNAENLAPAAIAELRARYEGTRLGRQELFAEVLTDVVGSIATIDELDACRVCEEPDPVRTIVAVDPAVTDSDTSDETGIAVLSRGDDGHCYMLYDYSCRTSVNDWARRAVTVAMADEVQAGMILYEKNQGADAIGSVLRNAIDELGATGIVLKDVTASKSKFDRALPLQQWIQQNRFHLVGSFPELEEQLTTYTADTKTSPDRLDAVVHGFTELMLSNEKKRRLTFRG
jgi:phage terminase large subunit-like protein